MTKAEIEKQKSLALAELMGLKYHAPYDKDEYITIKPTSSHIQREFGEDVKYKPYASDEEGLAQFAAILLKFPEVMPYFVNNDGTVSTKLEYGEPTQVNILDEILRMNNKWQDEWND